MSTCFFIGHRDAPDSLFPKLSAEVERHISEYGVTDFVAGGYGRFDALAVRSVREAKKRHPEVTLTLLLAYYPCDRTILLPEGVDSIFYPPGLEFVPRRAAIVQANRYMVEHSQYLIAYAWQTASNAGNIVKYAKSKKFQDSISVTLIPH